MMDLSIKINKRNGGKFHQKARFGQSKCRHIAMKDISEDAVLNRTINYISIESKVLSLCATPSNIVYLDL